MNPFLGIFVASALSFYFAILDGFCLQCFLLVWSHCLVQDIYSTTMDHRRSYVHVKWRILFQSSKLLDDFSSAFRVERFPIWQMALLWNPKITPREKYDCHCGTIGLPVPSISLAYCPICSIDFPDSSASPCQADTGIIKELHQSPMRFENFSTFIILATSTLETPCKWHLLTHWYFFSWLLQFQTWFLPSTGYSLPSLLWELLFICQES